MKNSMQNDPSTKETNEKRIVSRVLVDRLRAKDILLAAYDVVAITIAYFFALWFRFDCQYTEIPSEYFGSWLMFTPIYAVISIAVFAFFRLYRSIWRFASFDELKRIIYASGVLAVLHAVGITLIFRRMPISYYVIGAAIQFMLIAGIRFSYRFVLLERSRRGERVTASRVMLIGAGSAGQMILRDLQLNAKTIHETVCCIIDDDKKKQGRYVDGVPVVGGREDILLNVEKYKIEIKTAHQSPLTQRKQWFTFCWINFHYCFFL